MLFLYISQNLFEIVKKLIGSKFIYEEVSLLINPNAVVTSPLLSYDVYRYTSEVITFYIHVGYSV